MKLAIVGSKFVPFDKRHLVIDYCMQALLNYHPHLFISGGATGVDSLAESVARERNIECLIHRPTSPTWKGVGGYEERNRRIAEDCDYLIRIVVHAPGVKLTHGSGWTRAYANNLGKPTEEYVIA